MNKNWVYVVKALQIGLEIFGMLFICVFVGLMIDRYFNISPIGVLAGSFLGVASCFYQILKIGGKGSGN